LELVQVVGTVGSNDKVETLMQLTNLPRSQIIVRTTGTAFPQQLRGALNSINDPSLPSTKLVSFSGFDVILDSIAGDYFQPGLDVSHQITDLFAFFVLSVLCGNKSTLTKMC
jgi:hypothetical protein